MKHFKELPKNEVNNGVQYKAKFPNGYGASIVKSEYSYGGSQGLWELAVLDKDDNLTYDTSVTEDVLGYLSEEDVVDALKKIEALESEIDPTIINKIV